MVHVIVHIIVHTPDVPLTLPCLLTLTQVRVPKGRILAVCPFVSHHDPALYPNPDVFDPNRAPLTLPGDGTAVVTSVGGGSPHVG